MTFANLKVAVNQQFSLQDVTLHEGESNAAINYRSRVYDFCNGELTALDFIMKQIVTSMYVLC